MTTALDNNARYFDRDLSWLEFNRRVLDLAYDERVPLLERVKFLAIFSSNLDEFFMKRVGLLKRRIAQPHLHTRSSPGELPPREAHARIRAITTEMAHAQGKCWERVLHPALAEHGIVVTNFAELSAADRANLIEWYRTNVFPILTPLAVDRGHRFPFISNLSENLGVLLRRASSGPAGSSAASETDEEPLFARLKLPDVMPQFIRVDEPDLPLSEGNAGDDPARPMRLVAFDDLVSSNLAGLFPGLEITSVMPFRITRSASLEVDDDEADDLLEQVEEELRQRRFAEAVRVQVFPDADPAILRVVTEELRLTDADVFMDGGLLDETDLFELAAIDRPDLKDTPWRAVTPPALAGAHAPGDIFRRIRQRDILVHHPYESFEDSVERFVAEAADDPDVLAIKQTLYRTSRDSPFVGSLIEAAAEGKQVACLVELRARFDEEKNVAFARQLEKAGVHVAYGLADLKTHCKLSLVVRREREDDRTVIRTYAHIGTGNYHPGTAQLYTDLGVLTCHPGITADATKLFNALTGYADDDEYQHLLVAPATMRPAFEQLIRDEIDNASAGKPARIIAKMNSLEDQRIADLLDQAGRMGVRVTCFVRGFCCLRPTPENKIEVVSVMGRFLEHSRVFHFARGSDNPLEGDFYIGSGDWMYRNLNNRVEATVPVLDDHARASLWHILDTMLHDRRNAWRLAPDGSYEQLFPRDDARADSAESMGTFAALMADTIELDTPITQQ